MGVGSAADGQSPRISVVIACFDQARELELTLLSFLRQRLPARDYELIVVDDHSPDLAAREVVGQLRRRFPAAALLYVRQYRSDGGRYGSSALAKNVGLRLARGDIVFFNNAEIVQAGESLTLILERMEEAAEPLCLRGRILDLPFEAVSGLAPEELGALHDRTDRRRERVASNDHAGLAAMPRRLALEVGGNDERFDYWGKEDLDLAARLKRAGARYVYDGDLKSFHLSHPPNRVKEGDYLRMCRLLEENHRHRRVEANLGQPWGQLLPPSAERLAGTVIVPADGDLDELARQLEALLYAPEEEGYEVLVACLEDQRAPVERLILERFRPLRWVAVAADHPGRGADNVLRRLRTDRACLLPAGAGAGPGGWQTLDEVRRRLVTWLEEHPAQAPAVPDPFPQIGDSRGTGRRIS